MYFNSLVFVSYLAKNENKTISEKKFNNVNMANRCLYKLQM